MQREFTAHGRHSPQEDAPDEVGQALATWTHTLDETKIENTV
jgi:hypothetical protein